MKVKSLITILSVINLQAGATPSASIDHSDEARLSTETTKSDRTCGSPSCKDPNEPNLSRAGSAESAKSTSRARSYSVHGRRSTAVESFQAMFGTEQGKNSSREIFRKAISTYFENMRFHFASQVVCLTFAGIKLSEELFRGTTPEVVERLYEAMLSHIRVAILHNVTRYSCALTTFLECKSGETLVLRSLDEQANTTLRDGRKKVSFKRSRLEYRAPSEEDKLNIAKIVKKAILNVFAAHDTAFHNENDQSRNFGVHLTDNPGDYYVKLGGDKAEVVRKDARARRAATPAIGHIYNDDGEDLGRGSGVLLAGRRSAVKEETREALKNARENTKKAASRTKQHASSRPNVEIAAKRMDAKKEREKANKAPAVGK